jgi:hypothetical protein
VVGHTDPFAKRPEAPGSLEKAAHIRSRRAHAPVPPTPGGGRGICLRGDRGLTVANDAGAGFLGVVLLHAALAAGTTSLVPQAALKGDGTSAPTSGPVPRARDSGGGLSGRRGGAGGQ